MLLKEVFPYLTLASCQHGVSQTCKLIIAQLRMKSISWKALSPFLFSETGSESKQNRSHSYKVQKCMCIHLFFWHHLKWSISMNKCGNVSCSLKELSEISNFNFQLWIVSEEEHIGVVILDFCDISVNVAKIGQSVRLVVGKRQRIWQCSDESTTDGDPSDDPTNFLELFCLSAWSC